MIGLKLSAIFIAYILDLIFGDPEWAWHPIRIMGRLIEKLEKKLNVDTADKKNTGIILVILVVGITIFSVWATLELAISIHPALYFVFSVAFIYFAISVKSLAQGANRVSKALRAPDINKARKCLSMIVGRDTLGLGQPEIIRATVETVAESTMDGIIAPLFYAFLGGPIWAWAYKSISTLDSMIGYKNERFIDFGKAAAKIDGLANLIPAKITSFLILISGWCARKGKIGSSGWIARYFFKGARYNSESTEAAAAAVLGVQLGGLNFYNSLPAHKALIGDNLYPLEIKHIRESIKIAYISSVLFMAIGMFLIPLIGRR